MNKKLLLVLNFLVLNLLIIPCVHAENDRAFLWRVTSAQNSVTVYLFGSIHFADKSFYPLRPEIEQAFSQSQNLVVELDINNIDNHAYTQLVTQKGIYKDGATIKDKISTESWQKLREQLQRLDIDYESVKNYKPGILVLTLAAAHITKMGFDARLGIDAYFLAKAGHQSKQVIELETLEQQIELFLNIPDAELLLKESLYSLDEADLLMADMVRFWKQGDEKQLNKLLFEDALQDYPAFSKIYDSLFYDRNHAMVNKIEKMITQAQGSYFVVVGSGHMVGDQGIVNTLSKLGYQVERL